MRKTYVIFGLLFVMLLFSGIASAVAPVLSNEVPTDESTLWDVTTTSVNVTMVDVDSDINWTIDFTPDVGNSSGFLDKNGSKTCTISGLLFSTTYTWVVSAMDSNATGGASNYTNASYTFTTRTAKLRENAEFNVVEKGIVGVIGIIILIGFLYLVLKTDYSKEGLAKIFVVLLIALTLLTVIFSAL